MGGWIVLNRSIWGGKRRSSGVFEEIEPETENQSKAKEIEDTELGILEATHQFLF